MRRYWLASIVEDDGKYYAYGIPIRENENVVSIVEGHKLHTAMFCSTKKQMYEQVECWNNNFKANGTYMFNNEW